MKVVETRVHEYFAKQAENRDKEEQLSNGVAPVMDLPLHPQPVQLLPPFARVNSVEAASPAETAGLQAGDEIRNFGYVNHENHNGLRRVGECVQGNEGVSVRIMGSYTSANVLQSEILVKIARHSSIEPRRQELSLRLTPRRDWGGRGLLGCHILPL